MITEASESRESPFALMVDALLRIHRLSLAGKFESHEAEAIRDSTESVWHWLTNAEQQRFLGLSIDLNAIEASLQENSVHDPATQSLHESGQLVQAGMLDQALDRLRRLDPSALSPVALAYRGAIWSQLGFDAVAVLFFDRAATIRGNGADADNYRAAALEALQRSDGAEALRRSEAVLASDETTGALLYLIALGIANGAMLSLRGSPRVEYRRKLTSWLERAISRYGQSEPESKVVATVLLILAKCYLDAGDRAKALDAIGQAIRIDPSSDILFIARASLTYGTPQFDVSDYERAVALSTRNERTYLFLAQHYLAENRFDDARRMCERGLPIASSPASRSALLNLRGIAEAGLGRPISSVARSFMEAVQFDPENEFARYNLDNLMMATSSLVSPGGLRSPAEESLVPEVLSVS